MSAIRWFSCFLWASICSLQWQANALPIPDSVEEDAAICFTISRSLKDGALKASLLKQLKSAFDIDAFVETGTYLGDTTEKAARIFHEVHTIELSSGLAVKAKQRLSPWKNTAVHLGNSQSVLLELLPRISGRILFYLDGHYSGDATARASLDTPLLNELEAIGLKQKTDAVILIDDIRLFQASCFPEKIQAWNFGLETYPDLAKVVEALLTINPDYKVCFLGDALLAFPETAQVKVSPVVRACALHRLAPVYQIEGSDLRQADQIIAKAKGKERQQIADYFRAYSPFELESGYRSYGSFWYALVLKEEGDEERAICLLEQAVENSPPDWRASQLLTIRSAKNTR